MRAEGQREHGSLWVNSPSLDIKGQIQQEILSPPLFVNKQTNKQNTCLFSLFLRCHFKENKKI